MSNKAEKILIHCTASSFGTVNDIRAWHKELGWRDVGYHFVICNGYRNKGGVYESSLDGLIQKGRTLDCDNFIEPEEYGAHAYGYNRRSVGVVLVGNKTFTGKQFSSLFSLSNELCGQFGLTSIDVIGHYETPGGKAQRKSCPNFNMPAFRKLLRRIA